MTKGDKYVSLFVLIGAICLFGFDVRTEANTCYNLAFKIFLVPSLILFYWFSIKYPQIYYQDWARGRSAEAYVSQLGALKRLFLFGFMPFCFAAVFTLFMGPCLSFINAVTGEQIPVCLKGTVSKVFMGGKYSNIPEVVILSEKGSFHTFYLSGKQVGYPIELEVLQGGLGAYHRNFWMIDSHKLAAYMPCSTYQSR
jgi:hypothetical protein